MDLAKALAAKLGVKPDVAAFDAGEEVSDDLRNMVWKGHYLGGGAGDVMLHVPLDAMLAEKNPQVRFVAPYYREEMAVLRNVGDIPKLVGLEAFTRVKIGVEGTRSRTAICWGRWAGVSQVTSCNSRVWSRRWRL